MTLSAEASARKSRLAALLDHFSQVEDPRDVRRIPHPPPEVLLLVVCLTATDAAEAVPEPWAIENRLHRVLDVTFGDDLSRLRKGHGARNMATVRHFALNLVRAATDRRSIKSRRNLAGCSPDYVQRILASNPQITWIRSPARQAAAPDPGAAVRPVVRGGRRGIVAAGGR